MQPAQWHCVLHREPNANDRVATGRKDATAVTAAHARARIPVLVPPPMQTSARMKRQKKRKLTMTRQQTRVERRPNSPSPQIEDLYWSAKMSNSAARFSRVEWATKNANPIRRWLLAPRSLLVLLFRRHKHRYCSLSKKQIRWKTRQPFQRQRWARESPANGRRTPS